MKTNTALNTKTIKPLTPSQAQRELKALSELFNNEDADMLSGDRYDALKANIMQRVLTSDEFIDRDICSARHRGNQDSEDAFKHAKETLKDTHREILGLFHTHENLSAKEVAQLLGKSFNCVSGRLSELKALDFLEETQERRDGSRVLKRTQKEWTQ